MEEINENDIQVELIGYIDDIEKIIASSSMSTRRKRPAHEILKEIDLDKAREHIGRVLSYGHEGISEFAFFIFSVSGVSRVLTHQLVRHRMASYLQLSSRHIKICDFGYVVPPSIRKNTEAYKKYIFLINKANEIYNNLINLGIPKEDARYVIPCSIKTHIVIGMNARSLNNFFGLRLCEKAQWEIKILAKKMYNLVKDIAPSLFWSIHKPCVIRGFCPQEESCGFINSEDYKRERKKFMRGYPNEE